MKKNVRWARGLREYPIGNMSCLISCLKMTTRNGKKSRYVIFRVTVCQAMTWVESTKQCQQLSSAGTPTLYAAGKAYAALNW